MATTNHNKAQIIAAANTIWAQIQGTTPECVIWSWGIHKLHATEINGMCALAIYVSGLIHQGWLAVCYNEGTDTYEVITFAINGSGCETRREDVYFDELGQVIDELVERPSDMTDEEYERLSRADSERKIAEEGI